MAGLPPQLVAIFTVCPDYGAKLVHLTDILDLGEHVPGHVMEHVLDHVPEQQHYRQHGATGYRQHYAPLDSRQPPPRDDLTLWEPTGWAAMGAAAADGGSDGGREMTTTTTRNPLTARYLAALLTKELAERCEILNWQLSLVSSEKSENVRDLEYRLVHLLQSQQMDELRSLCHVVETSTRLLLALAGKLAASDRRRGTLERDRPGSRDQLTRRLEEAAALKRYADRRTCRLAAKIGDSGASALLRQFFARHLGLLLKADDILDQLRHMERQREALHILFVR